MDSERLLKKVMNVKVDGRNATGRPRFGWMDGVKRALNDRRMDMREASERARNRNEWQMIVMQFRLASAVATGLPYRDNPVVGAVGEMPSMKRHKLWKTGEDGLCCSSSAIQTRPGASSLFLFSLCVVGYPPNCGKWPRYIDRFPNSSSAAKMKGFNTASMRSSLSSSLMSELEQDNLSHGRPNH